MERRILLMEPRPARATRLVARLFQAGYQVATATDLATALAEIRKREPDAILVDVGEPAERAHETVSALKAQSPEVPILALAVPEHVGLAVALLERDVEDFVLFPPPPLELATRLRRMLERHDLRTRVGYFETETYRKGGFRDAETRSPAMRRLVEQVRRVAPIRSTVLILGESGVGKERIAREIHRGSPRAARPFIALNCAAMPATLIESELFGHEKGAFTGAYARSRGKFEMADGGTLFLDEIGEMELATQAKLLRVLEQKDFMRVGGDRNISVDVRLLAATNADLESRVRESSFRRDLFYRLKVIQLRVPPLRERREDLPALVNHFLDELSKANALAPKALAPETVEAFENYTWPGNVRELKNLIESLLVSTRGSRIEPGDLPPSIGTDPPPGESARLAGMTLAEVERELLRQTLEAHGGNRTHSARALGIGVRTLQRKIRSYDLDIAPKRRGPKKNS